MAEPESTDPIRVDAWVRHQVRPGDRRFGGAREAPVTFHAPQEVAAR